MCDPRVVAFAFRSLPFDIIVDGSAVRLCAFSGTYDGRSLWIWPPCASTPIDKVVDGDGAARRRRERLFFWVVRFIGAYDGRSLWIWPPCATTPTTRLPSQGCPRSFCSCGRVHRSSARCLRERRASHSGQEQSPNQSL